MKCICVIGVLILAASCKSPARTSTSDNTSNVDSLLLDNSTRIAQLSLEDSLFIEIQLAKVNKEYYADRDDSMGGWESGEVLYSCDSIIKVYSLAGEWMGAYGSRMYNSVCFMNNTKIADSYNLTAKSIFKLNKEHYLILTEGAVRMRGPEWSYFEDAYLINNKGVEKVCQSQLSQWIENSIGDPLFFENIDQEKVSTTSSSNIIFNKKEALLRCTHYGYNAESSIGELLNCFKVISTFKFNGNTFIPEQSDSTFDSRQLNW
jgi:hypothetical protein